MMINAADILNAGILIVDDEDSNLADADLEMETKPEDVLAEIKRLQRRAAGVPRPGRKLR